MIQNIAEFNKKYSSIINEVVRKRLGVTVNMQCKSEKYGELEDTIKTDVDKKMRGNKILRQLFKSIELDGTAYEFDNEYQVRLTVHYTHKFCGGSNGHDMLNLWFDKSGKILEVKDE